MTELYPHNQEAYGKVTEAFCTGNRAAVVHATGTGKSFIIEAVARDYARVLVIAPNHYVLGEVRKRDIRAEFRTYPGLLSEDFFPEDRYDLIVLDEFHRAGATNWGAKVRELLDANPEAKVLGTTATEIRYLDGQRNMADELFESNVVSRISLPDAWARGILPIPKYVIGLYDIETIYSDLVARLERNRFLNESECVSAKEALMKGRLQWESAHGVSAILKKHLPADTKRVIVFCDHIENLPDVQYMFTQWMQKAGFRTANYTVHNQYKDSWTDMEQFQRDHSDGVKVLFAIDMLNEGIHVPDVDAIVMLRSTQSRIIQLQQMGRCMNAGTYRTPVIFDLVDNLNSSTELGDLQSEYRRKVSLGLYVNSNPNPVKEFTVFDYVKDFRDIVYGINALRPNKTFEEYLEELKAFVEANGRWPKTNSLDEDERNLALYASRTRTNPAMAAFREEAVAKYGIVFMEKQFLEGFENHYDAIRDFIDKNGRWPSRSSSLEDDYEPNLRAFLARHYGRGEEEFDAFVTEMEKTYEIPLVVKRVEKVDKKKRFENLKVFVEENHRWPGYGSQEEKVLAEFAVRFKDFPGLDEFRKYASETYGISFRHARTSFEQRLEELKAFVEENRRWPGVNENDGHENRLYAYLKKHLNDDGVVAFRKEYARFVGHDVSFKTVERVDVEARLKELEAFVKERDKWPSAGKEGKNPDIQERNLALFAKRYSRQPGVKALRDEYELTHRPVAFVFDRDVWYPKVEAFVKEHGRWPRQGTVEQVPDPYERQLFTFMAKMRNTEKENYFAFRERVGSENEVRAQTKIRHDIRISDAAEFVERTHRWPQRDSKDAKEKSIWKFLSRNYNTPEVEALRKRCEELGFRFRKGEDERAAELKAFVEKNLRLPVYRIGDLSEESSLAVWMKAHPKSETVAKCRKLAGVHEKVREEKSFEAMLEDIEAYVRQTRKWPTHHGTGEEYRLGYFIYRNRRDPRIVELKKRLSKELKLHTQFSKEERLAEMDAFVKEHGRWPDFNAKEKEEQTMYHFLMTHKYRTDVAGDLKAIADRYGVPINYTK